MILYFKAPGMATGQDVGGEFFSDREVEEFLQHAPGNMEENTMFYYRRMMEGRAWILKGGKMYQIWNPHIHRKYGFTLAEVMQVAPITPAEELLTT